MLKKLGKYIIVSLCLYGMSLTAAEFAAPVNLLEKKRSVQIVDFNGDKLPDLIMGNYGGNIFVSLNEGTDKKPLFKKEEQLKSDDKAIKITHW